LGFATAYFAVQAVKKQQGKEFVYKLLVQFGRADRPIFSAGASGKGVGEGRFAPPLYKNCPPGRLHAKDYYLPSYAYTVGTVVFDASIHEAN